MSKGFTLGITEEDVAKVGGGNTFIGTSGVYETKILAVVVDENENGATSLGFLVELGEGHTQMLYGALPLATFDNKTKLDANIKTFGALCMLADVPVATKFKPVEATLPIGKGGADKDVYVLDEFNDVEVKMWIKQEYFRKGDGTIGDKRLVKRFYRIEDDADASEINNTEAIGTRFQKDSKYHEEVAYKDVTEADVKAMIDGKKSGSKPTVAPATKPNVSRFAKK